MTLPKSPVRQLAWDYYLGKVGNHNEFRQKRELIINAMLAGEAMPDFDSAQHPVDPSEITEIPAFSKSVDTGDTPNSSTPGLNSSTNNKNYRMVSIAVASLSLIAIAGYFLFADNDPASIPPQALIAQQTLKLPDPLQHAIDRIEQSGWSNASATQLLAQWNTLPGDSRARLRESSTISAVTERVADRAAELITMAGAGVAVVPAEKALINELAAALKFPQPNWPAETIETVAVEKPTSTGLSASDKTTPPESPRLPQAQRPKETFATVSPIKTTDSNQKSAPTTPATDATAPLHTATDSTEAKATKPQPIPAADAASTTRKAALTRPKKPSRPASIVMSEREGCAAEMINLRVRTCRDFLSRKVRAPRMVVMPSGSFTMGDSKQPVESPTIEVTISTTLAISSHEISFREFLIYCKNSSTACPTNNGGDRHQPVVGISWQQATNYAAWLSERTGKQYRLPSEAEWEYAARAGSHTLYPFGDKLMVTQARFSERNRTATEPLSNSYQAVNPNGFQLYHMVGNVREWVADAWQDHHDNNISDGSARIGSGQRVVRGGSFADPPERLRSSARQPLDANTKDRYTGFRVVLDFAATTS